MVDKGLLRRCAPRNDSVVRARAYERGRPPPPPPRTAVPRGRGQRGNAGNKGLLRRCALRNDSTFAQAGRTGEDARCHEESRRSCKKSGSPKGAASAARVNWLEGEMSVELNHASGDCRAYERAV